MARRVSSAPSHAFSSAGLSRRTFGAAAAACGASLALGATTARADTPLDFVAQLLGIGGASDAADASGAAPAGTDSTDVAASERPRLLQGLADSEAVADPCAPDFVLADDLSNVINTGDFYLLDKQIALLRENGFYVMVGAGGYEFFETYEQNRYNLIPNFVTVDSLMHTYHLYFSHLLRNTERDRLAESVRVMSAGLYETAREQLVALGGSEWEDAAVRVTAFFGVAAALIGAEVTPVDGITDLVNTELSYIYAAGGLADSPIFGQPEDYTQYTVRGYYEGDAALEGYFRAMMWYGRMCFLQSDELLSRAALLVTLALETNADARSLWETTYTVTSFFAGEADDLGYCEYAPVLRAAYGEGVAAAGLPGNTEAWDRFCALASELAAPRINSLVVADEGTEVDHLEEGKGLRLMGQRFSIDESIFQELVYSTVAENEAGEKRLLPNALDVPAALGSDVALGLLEQLGATAFPGYSENMEDLRASLTNDDAALWQASLYSQWLNTLRPLLEERESGYPPFMRNDAWRRKNLQTFLGSYAELKHDTILYSKQIMAEAGGGPLEERDDRGYVEPEPQVFGRLAALCGATSAGLAGYGLLSDDDAYNLGLLQDLAAQLETIARKELADELPTDEEFDLIRGYGAQLEHFWQEVYKNEESAVYLTSAEFPAAIVADVATDPNGRVLEVATGNASEIYVVVSVGGALRLATGTVYSFYQFEQPLDQRLTDTQWRQLMGIELNDAGAYDSSAAKDVEWWTKDFAYSWNELYQ